MLSLSYTTLYVVNKLIELEPRSSTWKNRHKPNERLLFHKAMYTDPHTDLISAYQVHPLRLTLSSKRFADSLYLQALNTT